MFPFQEECFNPQFPLFMTRRVMTPSTLFARHHTFQIRLCQPPPRPNCAFVYLKIHQMIGPPTLHAQMAVDAKSVTTPTCTAATLHRTTLQPTLQPTLHRMTGQPTLHRMAFFMNPAQMAVDAKSVTTPTCTATTLN